MPAVNLSPMFNGQQFFTTAGTPLIGGLLNTYLAGTNTPAATYSDSGGTALNSNPIQLDTAGLLPSELWLLNAIGYKFVLTDSAGANPRTYDNITAPLAASASASSYSTAANAIGFYAQLLAVGGNTGYEIKNQLGNRVADFLYWGSSSSPSYGMSTNSAGINTPSGVPFSIGTNDTVKWLMSATTNDITAQGVSISRVKTATTSRANSSGLADDAHLIAPLTAGTWSFDLWIPVWGTTAGANGFKYQMAFSGTASAGAFAALAYQAATLQAAVNFPLGTPSFINPIDVGTTSTSVGWIRLTGGVIVTVAGNLSLQWAQQVSGALATNVGIGGWLNCVKVG